MCGIAVIFGITGKPAERAMLERMSQSLVHRGPDDSGHYLDGTVGLGFRRLAILDLSSSGHQPMISEDERFVLVFNGEIFNYVELRKELIDAGYAFHSTGDSEVLLNAYRHWGADCLAKFNGMWAFTIYDRTRGVLFGSRDRFGVKPLFIYRDRDQFLFASEIKAIRASGVYRGSVNWKVASRYLLEGSLDDTDESFYDGIDSIPAGSAFELDLKGAWRSWMYWDLDQVSSAGSEEPAREFAELFEDAVRLRMRSDVPVGVCLSGGLDSTSIICSAVRQREESSQSALGPLRAFCYMAKEFDESRYISDTLAQTGAELMVLQTSPRELWDSLPRMLWYHDEPVHTLTAAVGYHLMNLVATSGVRVVLNGQGADETIGGYSSFFPDYWRELMSRGRWVQAMSEIQMYVQIHGGQSSGHAKDASTRLLASLLQRLPLYSTVACTRYVRKVRHHPWFTKELTARFSGNRQRIVNRLNSVMKHSVANAPLPLYLRVEDRNSMAHSVEARLPFLDYRLVSFLFGLPAHQKVRGPWNKFVLREAMRGRIPEAVRMRADKMGFPTAGQKWFAHDLYEPMADLLSSREVLERGIYNVPAIVAELARHRRGEVNAYHDLFHLAQFEILMQAAKTPVVSPDLESP